MKLLSLPDLRDDSVKQSLGYLLQVDVNRRGRDAYQERLDQLLAERASLRGNRVTPVTQSAAADKTPAMVKIARLSSAGLLYAAMLGKVLIPLHQVHIDQALLRLEAGESTRLIIEAPPQHGKSQLTSICYPAWHLALNPNDHILLAAYGDVLARRFGEQARDLLMQLGPVAFSQSVDPGHEAGNWWHVAHAKGWRQTRESGLGRRSSRQ